MHVSKTYREESRNQLIASALIGARQAMQNPDPQEWDEQDLNKLRRMSPKQRFNYFYGLMRFYQRRGPAHI